MFVLNGFWLIEGEESVAAINDIREAATGSKLNPPWRDPYFYQGFRHRQRLKVSSKVESLHTVPGKSEREGEPDDESTVISGSGDGGNQDTRRLIMNFLSAGR